MSPRSMRRANDRSVAKARRRETLMRRRTGLVTGAAIGAAAIFAGPAQGAAFQVTSPADGPANACDADCTLRDAITDANAAPGPDTITFASELSGQTIVLTQDQLEITDPVAIDGGGVITVSGDSDNDGLDAGDFRIFQIGYGAGGTTLAGLTLTEGAGTDSYTYTDSYGNTSTRTRSGPGGAVVSYSGFTLSDVTVTGNLSPQGGGGVEAFRDLTVERSNISDNRAPSGGGIGISAQPGQVVKDSTITGNQATGGPGGGIDAVNGVTVQNSTISGNTSAGNSGAGINGLGDGGRVAVTDSTIADNVLTNGGTGAGIAAGGPLDVQSSTISGNTGATSGGGVFQNSKYGEMTVEGSAIRDNSAQRGGGVFLQSRYARYNKYGPGNESTITRTTIDGNSAAQAGGGLAVAYLDDNDDLTLDHSTVSGNSTGGSGGGIQLALSRGLRGAFVSTDSTVSGNTAAGPGGGVSVGQPGAAGPLAGGSAEFDNSTVAANTAANGGGMYLNSYPVGDGTTTSATIPLTSTIVGDNSGQDLDRADGSGGGGFDLAFSLVEAPGDAPLFQGASAHNIVGADPQLGPLADNGGSTRTHLPATTSPAIDTGDAPARLETDQRDQPRTRDGAPANPEGGDGTDIGSVEIDRVPAPAAQPTPTPSPTPTPTATPGPGTTTVLKRVRPGGIVVRITPSSDTKKPFTFKTTGRIVPPIGMTRAEACSSRGIVAVQVKRFNSTISNRRTRLKANCRFSSSVTFKHPKRFAKAKRLKFTVRFAGNRRLEAIAAKPRYRRVR